MPARPYSTQLVNGFVALGEPVIYAVEEGYRVVVRDIVYMSPLVSNEVPLHGITVAATATGTVIDAIAEQYLQPWRPYHWEGRQALDYGDGLTISSATATDFPWSVRVFGFVFQLPS
jgi:hypothetical protein